MQKSKFIENKITNLKLKNKFYLVIFIASILFISAMIYSNNNFNAEREQLNEIIDNDMQKRDNAQKLSMSADHLLLSSYEFLGDINEVEYNITDLAINYSFQKLLDLDIESIIEFEDAKLNFNAIMKSLLALDIESKEALNLVNNLQDDFDNLVYILSDEIDGYFYISIVLRGDSENLEIISDKLELLFDDFSDDFSDYSALLEEFKDTIYYGTSQVYEYLFEHEEYGEEIIKYIFSSDNISLAGEEHRQLQEIQSELRNNVAGNATKLSIFDEFTSEVALLSESAFNTVEHAIIQTDTLEEIDLVNEELNDDFNLLITFFDDDIKEEREELLEVEAFSRMIVMLLLGVAFTVSVAITILISNISNKSVMKLVDATSKIGEGDLDKSNELKISNDEFGVIANSVENMRDSLHSLVMNIGDTAGYLVSISEDFSSSAEEINSSAEEVASTSQAMSDGATTQTDLVTHVNEEINMLKLAISDIIKKIQMNTQEVAQIALQTNILALNAGIEASRAGDYGRGFAVVAENVRKLSDQSKLASERIDVVASEIFENISETMDQISNTMTNVVSVSEETAASAEEVAAAAEEMTASMEELASAAIELTTHAEKSRNLTKIFKF